MMWGWLRRRGAGLVRDDDERAKLPPGLEVEYRRYMAYVCSRCGMPAVRVGDGWGHAEIADEAFCELIFGRGARPG